MSITRFSAKSRDGLVRMLKEKWELLTERVPTNDEIQMLFPDADRTGRAECLDDTEARLLMHFWKACKALLPQHAGIGVRVKASASPARLAACGFLRETLEPLNLDFVRIDDQANLDVDVAWPFFKEVIDKMPVDVLARQEDLLFQRRKLIQAETDRRSELNFDYCYRVPEIDWGREGDELQRLLREAELELTYVKELLMIYQGKRGKVGEPYKGPAIPE